jgi:MFS family permease
MRKRSDDKWYYSFLPFNVSGGSTSPLIPLFVTEGLRGTLADVGMVSALSSAASVPGSILWGNLSDTTKQRKLFVLLGFGGLGLALFMMGISTSIASYFFANFLLGLLSTAAAPIGTVLILEVYKREEWAARLADFSRVGGMGWVTGLALGSIWLIVMQDASSVTPMRALFILAGTLSALSILLAMKWIPEPEIKVERRSVDLHLLDFPLIVYEKARYMPNRILHVLSLSATNISINNFPLRLRKYYVVVFLIFAGALCFYVALPIYLKSYVGISSGEVFLIYVASSAASTLSYRYSGSLVGRRGGKKVQKASILARMLLFPTFFLVTLLPLNQPGLVLAFLLLHAMVGIAWAGLSVAGSALVSNLCYKEFRAEGMGMYNATQGLAAIAGSIIGGFSAQLMGYLVTFLLASGMLLVAFLLLSFIDVETAPDEKAPKGNGVPTKV